MFLSGRIKKNQKPCSSLLGDLGHIKFLMESGTKGRCRGRQATKRAKKSQRSRAPRQNQGSIEGQSALSLQEGGNEGFNEQCYFFSF